MLPNIVHWNTCKRMNRWLYSVIEMLKERLCKAECVEESGLFVENQ